jgi:hypothetical protein
MWLETKREREERSPCRDVNIEYYNIPFAKEATS